MFFRGFGSYLDLKVITFMNKLMFLEFFSSIQKILKKTSNEIQINF